MSKGAYIGVDGAAKKIKNGYVGILTDVPIYEEEIQNIAVTASNITNVFSVTNGSYYFAGSDSTFTSNNGGVHSSTASTVLTALSDMAVSFTYSYSSESNYDKFTLKVGGTTVENAVSGATTTKTYSGSLAKGQTIEFTYAKDSSQNKNEDKCTFSGMTVVATVKDQVGTEAKSLARRIKKAYIGIGGVARPCWNDGSLKAYGAITSLSQARARLAGVTLGGYALFGGGEAVNTGTLYNTVNAYDETLTMTTPASLYTARFGAAAASAGDTYAVFAGGSTALYASGRVKQVDAFDKTFTRTVPVSLCADKFGLAGVSIGDHALFGGGSAASSSAYTYDSYDSELTSKSFWNTGWTCPYYLAATKVGNHALFAGGIHSPVNYTKVNSVDEDLTVGVVNSDLTVGRNKLVGATAGDFAIFAGGENYDQNAYYDAVDAYDTNLTKVSVAALSKGRTQLAGVSVGKYALFAGGLIASGSNGAHVDIYDDQLTHTIGSDLSVKRHFLAGARVGDFAIFAGGRQTASSYFDTADAYTVG